MMSRHEIRSLPKNVCHALCLYKVASGALGLLAMAHRMNVSQAIPPRLSYGVQAMSIIARIVNLALFPFGETVEMEPGCVVRYWRTRPIAYRDGGWRIL